MNKIIDFFQKRSELILPYILSSVLGCAVFSIYGIGLFSVFTLAVLLINAAMFAFCGFIDRHRIIGGALIVVLIIVLFLAFLRLAIGRDLGSGFSAWFLTAGEHQETRLSYLLALTVSFPFFFAVVIYYFTRILYRMSFVTLVSLIPCTISVKVIASINTVYVAVIAILNVAILITELHRNKSSNTVSYGKFASAFSGAVYIFILLLISAVIPKESSARYYEIFEMLFMDNTATLSSDFSRFSDVSGNADMYKSFQNRLMYTIYAEDQLYFKRQTFDFYDFENDYWTYDYNSSLDPFFSLEDYHDNAYLLDFSVLQQAYAAAAEADDSLAEKYGLSRLIQFSNLNDDIKTADVQAENFGAYYIPTTSRSLSVNAYYPDDHTAVTKSGVFRTLNDYSTPTNLSYKLYYRSEIDIRNYWCELGGADFTDEQTEQLLADVKAALIDSDADNSLIDTVDTFISMHSDAENYKTLWQSSDLADIPVEITALAEEITANCTYDWEKANALVQYFQNGNSGYRYNLDYVPPDNSIEYFIFESKTGTCSEFATAFSLLARSVGLNVRYCEGYSPDYSGTQGKYYIRDSSSHAYPEVYLQGMGWFVYEPTVASPYNSHTESNGTNFQLSIDYTMITVICIIAGIAFAVTLLVILISPRISESLFLTRMKRSGNRSTVDMVYKRILKLAEAYFKKADTLTPYELSLLMLESTGCDIGEYVLDAEEIFYGGRTADNSDKELAEKTYISLKNAIKNERRNKNEQKKTYCAYNRRKLGYRR